MKKKYSNVNVYDATNERLKFIFDEFENVLVSFSGGKDSGVMLNLVIDYAKSINALEKVSVFCMDYEADYTSTNEYIERTFNNLPTVVKKYWLCLPITAKCGCSMHQNYWIPWDEDLKHIWCRDMPSYDYVINIDNLPSGFKFEKGDYGARVRESFADWFVLTHGKTANLVGVRCDESLDRLAILTSSMRVNMYNCIKWSKKFNDDLFVFYPIYDWKTSDIWVVNYKLEYDYNKAYDLMYLAGVKLSDMRVASPFHTSGIASLNLFKALSPNSWHKMVNRVNGVNFANMYGNTSLMGWKTIQKPKNFTWKEYAYFLLDTLPQHTRDFYLEKIEKSIWHWKVQGGARTPEFIQTMKNEGWKIRETDMQSKSVKVNTHKRIIYIDDFNDDTNADEFYKAPSWKRVCICILKNDTICKTMGFSQTKKHIEKQKEILNKYKGL